MAEAMLPRPGQFPEEGTLAREWTDYRPDARELGDFERLCGLAASPGWLPPLFVHALAFRLQMALLCRRTFPLPIWRVLQVRNALVDLEPIPAGAQLDFHCRLLAHRAAAKGTEADLLTSIHAGGRAVARSVNTFYHRGGGTGAAGVAAAESPAPLDGEEVNWHMPRGGGLAFGRLTGDYNGIHLADGYARLFGFRRAFFHPLRVVGQALAHAAGEPRACPVATEIWLKGPVWCDSDVRMRVSRDTAGRSVLAVHCGEESRPAIVIRRGDFHGA